MARKTLIVVASILCSCCALHRSTSVPVPTLAYAKEPGSRASTLVIFLPGKGERGGDFLRRRFVGMARESGVDADLVEADLHLGYYLEGSSTERLWADVVAPARAAGYLRIWIVGISLGGSGAIGLAREHPASLAGLVLLSPYLGPPDLTERIRDAGGLERWSPGRSGAAGFEGFFEENWSFLRQVATSGGRSPALYLGYGRSDRLAPSLDLLATSLPAGDVVRVAGGHRWGTWERLWAEFLERRVITLGGP